MQPAMNAGPGSIEEVREVIRNPIPKPTTVRKPATRQNNTANISMNIIAFIICYHSLQVQTPQAFTGIMKANSLPSFSRNSWRGTMASMSP